jgi:uncharacterized protein YggE
VIAVVGTGRAAADPDVVRVRLGVSVLRPVAAAAVAAADDGVRRVRAALTALGVPPRDASTQGLSVAAEQVWTESEGPRITGFRADHELLVTLRDLGAVGQVLGELLTAGGDDARLHGVEFAVEDADQLRAAAREAAWWDAVARATQLAGLAGCRLGAVQQLIEGTVAGPGPMMFAKAEVLTAAAGTMDVQPGTVSVEVTLSVSWATD